MARGLLITAIIGNVGASFQESHACDDCSVSETTNLLQVRSTATEMDTFRPVHATTELSWFCYAYAYGQNDEWCGKTSSIGALELHYNDQGAEPCGGTCKCCARAARREAAMDAPWPAPPISTVEFATCETRENEVELWLIPGVKPKNICAGVDWDEKGYMTKTAGYRDYVEKVASSDPNQMVVVLDTDMGWGGCSEEELLSRYRDIVEASGGATVVAGADAFLWPPTPAKEDFFLGVFDNLTTTRRKAMFDKFGMVDTDWEAFMPGPRAWKHYGPNGTHANDFQYKGRGPRFLNSGFFMGPAKDVLWLLECSIKNGWAPGSWNGGFDDQLGALICAAEQPEKVTIDYTSLVVSPTIYLRNNIIQFQGKRILNNVAGKTQCFVHANGGMDSWKPWLKPATAAMVSMQ